MVMPDWPHMTIRRMRTTSRITKATDTHTHSEYEIFIAFPRQQWLRERALILHLYVHCLSFQATFAKSMRLALKTGPTSCPETSIRNYHYSLRNNPEERSFHCLSCFVICSFGKGFSMPMCVPSSMCLHSYVCVHAFGFVYKTQLVNLINLLQHTAATLA
jgi:hypothetical protein